MVLTAFAVPVFIVTGIYIASKVFPFGEQCFLKTDMYHQYAPFFAEFRRKLREGGSLLYSRNVGLGVNFLAIFAYYLASPLNFLVILAPENGVIEFMNILMILKLGLISVSFTLYLRMHMKRKDAGFAFFGILYALSGYLCAYFWNLMWLSCLLLFPLIMLALEYLCRTGRVFPYALLLSVCILNNYYISIMICIFLVIYFLALYVLDPPENFREFFVRGLRFAVGSLTAGLAAAVLLLPAFYALKLSASGTSTFPKTVKEYFSILEMLGRMLPSVNTEQALEHWPNIYSGTFVLILFPLYLQEKRISAKEKSVYLFLLLLLLASFAFNFLDYIWHGFHFPNSLPCRQSFVFVFLVLFMSARVYTYRHKITRKELGISLAAAVIFILYIQKGADTKYYNAYTFYLALGLCSLYALCLSLYRKKKLPDAAAFMFTLALVACEVTINAAETSFTTCSRTYYVNDNRDIRELISEVEKTDPDTDLFRYEKISRKTKDDGAWIGFPSVSLFSSTADAGCTKFFTKLGCEGSTNAYSITGSTPLVDMLLDIKYGFYPEELPLSLGKKLVDTTETTWLYENENRSAIGFIIPEGLTKDWVFDFDSPVLVQNSICDVLEVPQVLTEITTGSEEKDGSYSVYIPEDGEYYAYVTNTAVKSVSVSTDGTKKNFDNLDRKYLIELSELLEDDYVKITPQKDDQKMSLKLYRFDHEALKLLTEALCREKFVVTKETDTRIDGTISVTRDHSELFFSLPYDEGWKVFVDGEEAKTHEGFGGTFLCVTMNHGTHDVSLRYKPKGFVPGLLMSLLGLVMLLVLFFTERNLPRERNGKEEELEAVPEKAEPVEDAPVREAGDADSEVPAEERETPL